MYRLTVNGSVPVAVKRTDNKCFQLVHAEVCRGHFASDSLTFARSPSAPHLTNMAAVTCRKLRPGADRQRRGQPGRRQGLASGAGRGRHAGSAALLWPPGAAGPRRGGGRGGNVTLKVACNFSNLGEHGGLKRLGGDAGRGLYAGRAALHWPPGAAGHERGHCA